MITGKQRAFLRGLANRIDATVQVGKGGVNGNMVELVYDALERNELVKVHVLENSLSDVRDVCSLMAERTGAQPVQVIGSKFVLYKPSAENRRIDLKNLVVQEEKKPKREVKPLYKAREAERREKKKDRERREKRRKFFAQRRSYGSFSR